MVIQEDIAPEIIEVFNASKYPMRCFDLWDRTKKWLAENPSSVNPDDALMFFAHSTPLIAFLESHDWDTTKAFNGIKSIAKKRHSDPTTDVVLLDFPKDYHELGALLPNLVDKNGRPVLWVRSIDPPELLYPKVMRMFAWVTDRFCERVSASPLKPGLVFDCQVMTTNFRLIKDSITIVLQRCPPWVEYIAIVGLSSYFRFFGRICRNFLPRYLKDSLIFIDIDDLDNYFDMKQLPHYLGGETRLITDKELEQCPSLQEYAEKCGLEPTLFDKWRENAHSKYMKHAKPSAKIKPIEMFT
ncbi:uncharacterized protein LOC107363015 [Tetranychus urticae]|uniref:CRAL-TRIO domain-containing protein n=1 Tax=Tetranychus urticae TaxID=32264 RepID=T1KCT1_TETUR|nr:uncharacterized protein LOC107363015 [Tetranychus urticae]